MIKKIIFDLDNTLLFISEEWKTVYIEFINKYNLNISPTDLYNCIGKFEKDINDKIITTDFICAYINEKLPINLTKEMFIDLLELYADIPLLHTDTIYNVLEYLSQKYELIVYTNWFSKNQIDRLKKYNLDKFFSKIYGWDDLELKPSKIGIKKIIGNDNIKEYIFIGDNIEFYLKVPSIMGMNTIFFNRKKIVQNQFNEILKIEELTNIL